MEHSFWKWTWLGLMAMHTWDRPKSPQVTPWDVQPWVQFPAQYQPAMCLKFLHWRNGAGRLTV